MPLHVAVTGASGLIGRALESSLTHDGHRVTRLVRHPPAAKHEIRWDPDAVADLSALGAVDAIVHLAGENIAGGRWTARRRAAILASRRDGTANLVASLLRLPNPPHTLIAASAIGIYGDRGDERLTEASPTGAGFLAEVGREWEAASAPAERTGIRVVRMRFGVVLARGGGALARMLPAFRAGVAGRLGSGHQWMSWVALDDVVEAVRHAILTDSLRGPANVTAPTPVTNGEFTLTLARLLRRPAVLPIPAVALRLVLGRLADEALLTSQRVLPTALLTSGYRFRCPTLEAALRHLLDRGPVAE